MVVDELSDEQIDRIFHALADSTRRDIIRRSLAAEHSVSFLARQYPISLAAVQKHVGVLVDAGLVVKQRSGREQLVVGRVQMIANAQRLLDELEHLWRARFDRMAEVLADDPQEEQK